MTSEVSRESTYTLTVSDTLADLLLALLFRLNWNDFPVAEELAHQLEDAGSTIDDVTLEYNASTKELDRVD